MTTRHDHEDGFTLIELLVVIIILGILSAVVVFAVRGADDKGEAAAIATDKRTIRTAMEVYCAQKGTYPVDPPDDPAGSGRPDAMDVLVNEKFLSDRSEHHTLHRDGTEGNCAGEHYRLEGPGSDDVDPPGFVGKPDALCGDPQGQGWCPAIPPVASVSTNNYYNSNTLIQLSSGKVLALTVIGAKGFELFDPITNTWSAISPPTDLVGSVNRILSMIEITGTECDPRCGMVLAHFTSFDFASSWRLLDPEARTWLSPPTGSLFAAEYRSTAIELPDSGACAVQYCGKLLFTYDAGVAELYDPRANQFEIVGTYSDQPYSLPTLAPLPDGKVLLTGYQFDRETKVFDPNVTSVGPFTAQVNPSPLTPDASLNPAVVLPDGSILQIGHYYDPLAPPNTYPSTEAQIYTSGEWERIPSCRQSPDGGCWILARLTDGKVLAHAGSSNAFRGSGDDTRTFLFDPAAKSWTQTGSLNNAGTAFSGVLIDPDRGNCRLNCGKVLAVGGDANVPFVIPTSMAELYTPPSTLTP